MAATPSAVAKIWWKNIKKGTVLYAECPSTLKPSVVIYAKADVLNGVITAEEYEMLLGEPYVLTEE